MSITDADAENNNSDEMYLTLSCAVIGTTACRCGVCTHPRS